MKIIRHMRRSTMLLLNFLIEIIYIYTRAVDFVPGCIPYGDDVVLRRTVVSTFRQMKSV